MGHRPKYTKEALRLGPFRLAPGAIARGDELISELRKDKDKNNRRSFGFGRYGDLDSG
jgi:hypothetical protein